jgi:RimJ/RimL family protein N-acetyltransferase
VSSIAFPIGGIDDGTLRLRFRTDADLEAIVAAAQDPEIPRWTLVPAGYDLDDAREFAERAQTEADTGEALSLIVVDAGTDAFLGSLGVIEFDHGDRRCEIGYWLAPWARGRGVMTRAIPLLCRWLFDELGMMRIAAAAEPENERSLAVLERVGFKREGIARSLFENNGRRRDVVYFSLLPGELLI